MQHAHLEFQNCEESKLVFLRDSCADKLDSFFAEVAYKGKFAYNHTVNISISDLLFLFG